MAPLGFYREAGGRCQRLLSSRLLDSVEATRLCWLGAWRAARGDPFAWPSGLRGRGSAGAAPAGRCCRPRPAAWAAWPSAGGCVRLHSPCGCPVPARGPTAPARGRQPRSLPPEEVPPRRPPAPGGFRRAPPARYVRGSAERPDAGDGLCRDTHPVFWEVTGSQGVRSR